MPATTTSVRPTTAAVPAAVVTEVREVLLECAEQGRPLTLAEVVERIPVAAGQLEGALDQLLADGEITPVPGGVRLTDHGHDRAVAVVRRHRLVERMLSDLIGIDWWQVHHEAARFEGTISDDVERRLVEQLGDPGTCPHGNPIPGSSNRPDQTGSIPLADAPLGPVHVVRVSETLEGDDEALQLLQECGFLPDHAAEIKDRRDGWVEVAGSVHDAALPAHIAAHTYVLPR